jgi:hypothetical protein
MTKTTTPMTAELFAEWKRKKAEVREVGMTAKRAERARTDRMRYDFVMRHFLSETVVSIFVLLNCCPG